MAKDEGADSVKEVRNIDADEVLLRIGSAVRGAREASGISQASLSEQVGIDRGYLSQVERGKRNVSILVLIHIARIVNTTPSLLLKGIR